MTLPANDAFSLGLAHDQPRRSRTPSSPKIVFSPGMPARRKHTRNTSAQSKRTSTRTAPTPNGAAPPNGVHKPSPIDWEVPRKALHSSIGAHPYACHSSPVS